MKAAAAAVLALAFVAGGTATADAPSGFTPAQQQLDATFCTDAPAGGADTRIASAVDALGVSVPTTPPIAVLDTGVSSDMAEIAGRLVDPFDATTGGSDASDVQGHGSEVAGIAAGFSGLFQGVSPTSPVMPVRVYNLAGETTVPWLVGGISWAVQNHAAVINISSTELVSDASPADIASLTRATTDAFNHGTMVVASVGNSGNSSPTLPGSLPHVIAVGASDLSGNRSTFSNTGPWVDLVSPAASLEAPVSKAYCPSGFAVVNGSSFASAAVAGAAAILAQVRPTLTPQQRFDILTRSAHDVAPTGRDDETGYGLLDVQAALNMAPPPAESSAEVDDDPFYVRGANAAGHPVLLTRTKKARLSGELSPAKDPSDVYPIRVKKGERLTVSSNVSGANALIALGLWKPTAGDFDVSNEVGKNEIVSTGGFANDPSLKMDAKKTATYYLSVEAPDPVNPDDPTDQPPTVEPYKVVLSKVPTPKVKKHAKHKSSKKKSSKKH